MHVTGVTEWLQLPNADTTYSGEQINMEVYKKLWVEMNGNFSEYDLWDHISDGQFAYQPDDNLDMVVICRKRMKNQPSGFAGLDGGVFLIDTTNNISIRPWYGGNGSGCTVNGTVSDVNFSQYLGVTIHEIGHYLWGGHTPTGIMTSRGGNSQSDFFGSPFERLQLGYINPTEVNYGTVNYTIGDMTNRSTDNQTLKVPVGAQEYFLIENRRRTSVYDLPILGDTIAFSPFNNVSDIGKGIYIYHTRRFGSFPGFQDLECADGLWNWKFGGYAHPDWSDSQNVALVIRDSLPQIVQNDVGYIYSQGVTKTANSDGQSAVMNAGMPYFSLGKKHASLYQRGTDKLYTNTPEWWTSREGWGDRWDAYNLGYNDIFSPYSNPNSKAWYNEYTGVFILYTGLSGDNASFKIYKAGEGGYTEDEILELTPPSKPMLYSIEEYNDGVHCFPKIVWRQNIEPDMINSDQIPEKQDVTNSWKRYKIYKTGTLAGMSQLPQDQPFYPEQKYQHVATVDASIIAVDASWVDPNVYLYSCSLTGQQGSPYPVRYRVQAVDRFGTHSVLSDFIPSIGSQDGGVEDPGGIDNSTGISNYGSEIPTEYALKQNFPNPFNPITNIQFDLPQNNFVTLKIYDVMGREVATLVNEFKNAGRYIASFNASNISSGVYFYKVMAGSFVETKRMVLIK